VSVATPKVVGVLGGMGPEATADFFQKLIRATPAKRDQEHLRILIDNNPHVPDRTAAIEGHGESPGPHLAAMARGLVAQGAEVLVMPCNSAHAFAGAIRDAAGSVPFIDLIDTTVAATQARLPGVHTVGLLATSGALAAQLYQSAYARAGIQALEPTEADQEAVMAAIYAVKRAVVDSSVRERLLAASRNLVAAGAQALIAACTEVPLIMAEGDVHGREGAVPFISSTDALVTRTLAAASTGAHHSTQQG